jgi:legumain
MKSSIIFLILALSISSSLSANWAVLVAGSKGFGNYRHQADICHAYTSLIAQGIPASNIIVLHHDDAANSLQNPFRGKLFNKPSG